jgi:hypothetical protein
MLELDRVDLDQLGEALVDQGNEFHYYVDPRTGEVIAGLDENGEPEELDDCVPVEPQPPRARYLDMVDFAARVEDRRVAERLERALEGKGAFRRFRMEMDRSGEQLVEPWKAFRARRSERRAVEWLVENHLVEEAVAARFLDEHPD